MKSIVLQTLLNMNFKKLSGFRSRLNIRQLCLLFTMVLAISLFSDFSFGFEEVKFMLIVLTGTLFFVAGDIIKRGWLIKVVLTAVAGLFIVLFFATEEMKPSLWARSTETALSPVRVDSLVKAHQKKQGEIKKTSAEKPKELSPKATAAILFLLLSIVGLGSLYLIAVAAAAESVIFLFFFLALGVFALAGAIYFLHRIFRKEPFKKRLERTRADNKKEARIYFKILKLMLAFAAVLGLLIAGRLFF